MVGQVSFTYKKQQYSVDIESISADEVIRHNLKAIFERKRGELFVVDANQRLTSVTGVHNWLAYQWERTAQRTKIQQAVQLALQAYNDYLTANMKEQDQVCVRYLFDKKGEHGIGRWSQALYNDEIVKCQNILSRYLLPPQTIRVKLADRQFIDITDPKFNQDTEIFPSIPLSEVHGHNLKQLFVRKKGEVYQVDNEGKLQKVGCWRYFWDKQVIRAKVRNAVTDVVHQLNSLDHQLVDVVQHIFATYGGICRMPQDLFYRGDIAENSPLEITLHKELSQKRAQLIAQLQKPDPRSTSEGAALDLFFEEFLFVQKLGIDLVRNRDGGSGGARYAHNRFMQKILVVKPEDEGPAEANNPRWLARCKRLIMIPKISLEGNSEALAEIASWRWDRTFKIWSVPPTKIYTVTSRSFFGPKTKICSVHMFVPNAQTLSTYMQISTKIRHLPRKFVRWLLSFRREELLNRLPQAAMERVAVHNFGTEDLDCHVENILVKIKSAQATDSVFERLFQKNEQVDIETIQNVVHGFFAQNYHEQFIDNLLTADVNGEGKSVILIKHDGGATHPKHHPVFWDYFSLRLQYFFETLPHFDSAQFTEDVQKLIADAAHLDHLLEENGLEQLRYILNDRAKDLDPNIEEQMKQWIMDPTAVKLTDILCNHFCQDPNRKNAYTKYFNYHLRRIQGVLQTRRDSFTALKKYSSQQNNIRFLFTRVNTQTDFAKALR